MESGGGQGASVTWRTQTTSAAFFVSSFLNLVLLIFVALLCSLHSGISKTLHTVFRGENEGPGSKAETWQQTIKVESIGVIHRLTGANVQAAVSPAGSVQPGLGEPARPSALPRVPATPAPPRPRGRAALTASLPREPPLRPPPGAPGRPSCQSHLPGPRVRAAAVAAAPESECSGPRCRVPAVHASPALPKAARGGAQWQEAAALKPVSAAPDQTARPPRGAGPEGRLGGA